MKPKKERKKYKVEFVTSTFDREKLETKILTHFGTYPGTFKVVEIID